MRQNTEDPPDRMFSWGSRTPQQQIDYLVSATGVHHNAAKRAFNVVRIVFELPVAEVRAEGSLGYWYRQSCRHKLHRPFWKRLLRALQYAIIPHLAEQGISDWRLVTAANLARLWNRADCFEPDTSGEKLHLLLTGSRSDLARSLIVLCDRDEFGSAEIACKYWGAYTSDAAIVIAALDIIQQWVFIPRGSLRPQDLLDTDDLEYIEMVMELEEHLQKAFALKRSHDLPTFQRSSPLTPFTVDDFVRQALHDYGEIERLMP